MIVCVLVYATLNTVNMKYDLKVSRILYRHVIPMGQNSQIQISEYFYRSTIFKLRWYIVRLYHALLAVEPNNTNNVTVTA